MLHLLLLNHFLFTRLPPAALELQGSSQQPNKSSPDGQAHGPMRGGGIGSALSDRAVGPCPQAAQPTTGLGNTGRRPQGRKGLRGRREHVPGEADSQPAALPIRSLFSSRGPCPRFTCCRHLSRPPLPIPTPSRQMQELPTCHLSFKRLLYDTSFLWEKSFQVF